MLFGTPNNRTTCTTNAFATADAVVSDFMGTKIAYLLNLSMILRIFVKPCSVIGKSVIRSMLRSSNGRDGVSKGWSKP